MLQSDAFGAVPVMDVVNIYGKKWAQGLSPGNSEIFNLDYLSKFLHNPIISRVSSKALYNAQLPNTYIGLHTYIHTYMHTYIHTYIHTYVHTYIHAYMHTCIHT